MYTTYTLHPLSKESSYNLVKKPQKTLAISPPPLMPQRCINVGVAKPGGPGKRQRHGRDD